MKKQHSQQQDLIRITLDISSEQHAFLKKLAARRGISMQEYLLESLAKTVESGKDARLSDNEFKKLLKIVFDDNDEVLKRFVDK